MRTHDWLMAQKMDVCNKYVLAGPSKFFFRRQHGVVKIPIARNSGCGLTWGHSTEKKTIEGRVTFWGGTWLAPPRGVLRATHRHAPATIIIIFMGVCPAGTSRDPDAHRRLRETRSGPRDIPGLEKLSGTREIPRNASPRTGRVLLWS